MKRFARAGLVALLVLLAASWVMDAFATVDITHVAAVGWWSKRPAAQPTPGTNSFEVASGVDGTESVAAMRIVITGAVTKGTLVLVEASNPLTFKPKLQACPTDTPWVLSASPGKYADAPTPNCASPIALTRDDKGTWTGDVTALLSGPFSERSIMIVPAPDKSLPVPPTFFITFASPRIDAEGTPDVPAATTSAPAPVTIPAAVVPSGPSGPAPPSRPPATVAPTTPAAPTTVAPAAGAPVTPARFAVPQTAPKRKPWNKLVWILPLAALVSFGYTFGRKTLAERGVLAEAT
jgi:hypothetical protein